MRIKYTEIFKEVSKLALISHQALLPILLTIFETKRIVILARWCVYKIVFFFFWCAVLTVLSTDHHLDCDLTCNDGLH